MILEAGNRAAAIVENMLSFARKGTQSLDPCDLAELLDKTVALAEKDYDLKKKYDFKQIRIEREYEENVPLVKCEYSKIQQVFLNILKNGAEAMAEWRDRNSGDQKIPKFILRVRHLDGTVLIEIEDNGPGIPEQVCKRIFEPFFTTKPVGVGTGLGLSVSYFIITQNHAGEMSVESEPGKGARFVIKLPA
jgi:signal transduction histidine kinase